MQYTQDYDEKFPYAIRDPWGAERTSWRQIIQPYVKSTQLFKCPSNSDTNTDAPNGANGNIRVSTNYKVNIRVIRDDANNPQTLSNIQSSATRVMASEGSGNDIWGMGFNDWGGGNSNNWAGEGWSNHLGTFNVLFADGHVKALKPVRTMTPTNFWGGFDSPAGGCSTGDVNCEVTDTEALDGLTKLEAKYP
jgi:prepilin-type processing-associated H-X9-DG protein